MIRINLLGIPKTKRGKRAAAPSLPSEGPSPVFLGLIMFLATGVVLGYLYLQVNKQHDRLQNDLQAAIRENQRLSEVKATFEKPQKGPEQLRRRAQLIDQLPPATTRAVDL